MEANASTPPQIRPSETLLVGSELATSLRLTLWIHREGYFRARRGTRHIALEGIARARHSGGNRGLTITVMKRVDAAYGLNIH